MKNINQLLPSTSSVKANISVETKTSTKTEEQCAIIVNRLFDSLMMIKTGWRAMFPSINAKTEPDKLRKAMQLMKKQFLKGLIENEITTLEQLEFGLKKARADDNPFFPSVGEFIKWCKPDLADFGLPTAFEAWRIVSNIYSIHDIDWSKTSPAVHEAGKRCNFGDIKRGVISEKQFSTIYKDVCDEIIKGAVFEKPVYATENRLGHDHKMKTRTKTESNNAANAKAMAGLKF